MPRVSKQVARLADETVRLLREPKPGDRVRKTAGGGYIPVGTLGVVIPAYDARDPHPSLVVHWDGEGSFRYCPLEHLELVLDGE